ncbi:MAG: TrmH family RNA methyltransferase [Christensenellales bacterium]
MRRPNLAGRIFTPAARAAKAILVIGSEGQGISGSVRAAATHHLALPMRGGAESLNAAVAAGIMIYEMAREQA